MNPSATPSRTRSRVAITDVASIAGVSKMTVSRALRGDRGISQATRERIRALADSLGYRPDPSVAELMGRLRLSRIAELEPLAWMISHEGTGSWKTNPVLGEMYRGASEKARKLGYRLAEFSLNTPGMTPKRLSDILHAQGIRGIVMAPLAKPGILDGFAWERFATVCCDHSLLSPSLHRVSVDHYSILRVAWQRLTLRGYRRIGLCVSAHDSDRNDHRWQAAALADRESIPLADRVPPLLTDAGRPEVFLHWYETHRPDVVLSSSEVYHWMKAAGIRAPEDCGFALLRTDHASDKAGVDHRLSEIGDSAVSLLARELGAHQYGIPRVRQSVAIECVWRDGPTIRSGVAPAIGIA
jgi:LacI family transcriptional regulator